VLLFLLGLPFKEMIFDLDGEGAQLFKNPPEYGKISFYNLATFGG
jgi:hypothetical protein